MNSREGLDLAAFRRRLEEKLPALRNASLLTTEDRKPVMLDQSSVGRLSRIDQMQMREMARAAERRREVDLQRIEAALRRIDKGDYGLCTVCDEPIARKRLEADPAAPTCVRCAGGRA